MSSVDLGAIVRAAGEAYLAAHPSSAEQRKALRAIAACRTEALGGERQQCDHCGFEHIVWHSCRNRHCPRCQAAARAKWLEQRKEELLPVPYFHVVFTVPETLNVLGRWAPRVLFVIALSCASLSAQSARARCTARHALCEGADGVGAGI